MIMYKFFTSITIFILLIELRVIEVANLESNLNQVDVIGRLCSENITNAWLDLVVVVEVSDFVTKSEIRDKAVKLMTLFEKMNVNQGELNTHTSRIGVVVYNSDATVLLDLNRSTRSTLREALLSMSKYHQVNDVGNNVIEGLQKAYNLLMTQRSFRIPGIIIFSTTLNPEDDVELISSQLRHDGIYLIVITYDFVDDLVSPNLGELATPGLAFNSTDHDIYQKVTSSLSLMNCKCPKRTYQLEINGIKYGDCLYGYPTYISPILAHNGCKPGIIVSVNSKDKMNFITDKIMPTHLLNHTIFSTSGSFVNGYWRWLTYDNKLVPFGNYPEISPRTSGSFGYFQLIDEEWIFIGDNAGHHDTRPYICQIKSCDTDHFC